LLGLSGEEMQRELQRLFWTHVRPPEGPMRRGEDFNINRRGSRGPRPDDERPPPKAPEKEQKEKNAPKAEKEKATKS